MLSFLLFVEMKKGATLFEIVFLPYLKLCLIGMTVTEFVLSNFDFVYHSSF